MRGAGHEEKTLQKLGQKKRGSAEGLRRNNVEKLAWPAISYGLGDEAENKKMRRRKRKKKTKLDYQKGLTPLNEC
jgi:hypothetical protein